ncbi:SixA phosphatase family protein [Actinoallomurus acaciae]|uniref:Histidine phosphatase family protein n=1 Tax=Actinoallomurus acaciae TaxID=502577 RepID=A0ABV5Y931_9ACTN
MVADSVRTLAILRHAKSAWPDVADHQRPLADRGRRDAPRAGVWLRDNGAIPDHVLCSTARRARETWRLTAGALQPAPLVTYDDRLYDADVERVMDAIAEVPDRVTRLLLVGHAPMVQALTLYLAGDAVGDALARAQTRFPTCAIAMLAVPDGWASLRPRSGVLLDFVVPRG